MEFSHIGLLRERADLIKKLSYEKKLSIPLWRTRTATYTVPVEYENYSEWSEMQLGTVWECPYEGARWFEAEVTVPEDMAGKHLVLELNLGGEGLVSINGEPKESVAFYYAPDHGSKDYPIRFRTRIELGKRRSGEVLAVSVQINMNYKDHFKSNRFTRYDENLTTRYTMAYANLCAIDDETEGYYHDVRNVLEAVNVLGNTATGIVNQVHQLGEFNKITRSMNRDSVIHSRLIQALQLSMAGIPFFYEPEEMRQAIPEARRILAQELAKIPRADRGTVYMNGFAHIDLVWLWQEKHSVRKVANTFLNTLALIEEFPEYIFTFSQPCAFQWLEEHYPEIFKRVQEKVKAGNIDPVGNLWVEMDCNLAGGESIVRQLLYGRAYYLEKFGKCSDIFLMPDSFGYSAALPQIVAKSGIRYFLSAKLISNDTYRFPYTYFQWQGIDGTRIPTYLLRAGYNSDVTCNSVDVIYHRQENKTLDETMMTFGYGDGGGGPDRTMLESYRRLQDMPGIPKAKMAKMDTFFEKVTQNQDQFPVWNDELYFDNHRGTYTSQAKVKKNNRMAELALRKTEMAASMAEICLGIPYPAQQLEKLWKMILHMQFHDSLPGSSITPVYKDTDAEYARFFAEQSALFDGLLSKLTAAVPHKDGKAVAWNFLNWERTACAGDSVVTVPAMGYALVEGKDPSALSVSPACMENKFFRLTLDEKGRITSLLHKQTGREALKAPSNILELFDDPARPRMSAWDVHPEYMNASTVLEPESVQVVERGKTKGVIRVTYRFHKSVLTQDITIYSDTDRIDFVTHADWQETMRLLKAAFYPKVRSSRAAYEIQFGALERPTHRNTDYDRVRFEGCGHKWADLSQSDFGVSLLNDCKYGYDICDDRMRITLLRSPIEPDYKADKGEHDFTYSLYPHAGGWEQGGTVRAAFELNVPVELCSAPAASDAITAPLVSVESGNAVLDTFKKAEDGNGYILRLYEACGGGGQVTLRFAKALTKVTACDLMEQNEDAVSFTADSFTFETSPYCIHTYRVRF